MAAIEQEPSSKHDDFFDDPPPPSSAPATVENGHVSPAPEQTNTAESGAAPSAESNSNSEPPTETITDAEPPTETNADSETPVAANTEDSAPAANGEGETAAQEAPQADGAAEGTAATPSEEQQENGGAVEGANTVDVGATANGEAAPNEGDVPDASPQAEASEAPKQEETEATQPNGDVTEMQSAPDASEPETPQVVFNEPDQPAASRQSDYPDDFSDSGSERRTPAVADKPSSAKSSRDSSKSGTPLPDAAPQATGGDDDKPADEEKSSELAEADLAGGQQEPMAEVQPASSSPSAQAADSATGDTQGGETRADSRAEAGQVIPVDPPQEETKPANTDGRSSSVGGDERTEGDAFRGEDRTEMIAPEGSEDCRGQGQWKSAEQQAVASAMLVSKSEREMAEEAIKERDGIKHDYDALKIKDLQERLAVLARESEEKDKKLFRLENDLKETQARLRDTERRLLQAEASAGADAPKSKTCVVM